MRLFWWQRTCDEWKCATTVEITAAQSTELSAALILWFEIFFWRPNGTWDVWLWNEDDPDLTSNPLSLFDLLRCVPFVRINWDGWANGWIES